MVPDGNGQTEPATGLPADWPQPDPHALALSRTLAQRLCQRISESGPLPFDAWMESVLYEPGLGYYSAGQEKFGEAGDYVTAPGISSAFGWTLAAQCAEGLAAAGGDTILELGPGDGSLAADMLTELERLGQLPARYWLLERSGELRARQQARLQDAVPHLLDRVAWLDRLPERPLRGVIVANEVLDALPVALFRRDAEGVSEWCVTTAAEGFAWQLLPARESVANAVTAIEADREARLPEGYTSEVCLQLPAFVASLAECLEQGWLLLLDYGYERSEYYRPDRDSGTLVCHYRHRAHWEPLPAPGLQDLSAFVDFTAAALAADDAGLAVLGFATQAQFLLGAGITDRLEQEAVSDPVAQARLAQQAKTLLLPGAMGERFRVLAAGTPAMPTPGGFSLYNQIATL